MNENRTLTPLEFVVYTMGLCSTKENDTELYTTEVNELRRIGTMVLEKYQKNNDDLSNQISKLYGIWLGLDNNPENWSSDQFNNLDNTITELYKYIK